MKKIQKVTKENYFMDYGIDNPKFASPPWCRGDGAEYYCLQQCPGLCGYAGQGDSYDSYESHQQTFQQAAVQS